MAFHQTPICLELIQTMLDQAQDLSTVFEKGSQDFQMLSDLISNSGRLKDSEAFVNNPKLIAYLQLLHLASLSMTGGLFVPVLSSFTYQKPNVSLHWGDRLVDRFRFGILDSSFERFSTYLQHKILGWPSHQSVFDTAIFSRLNNQILQYKDLTLNVREKWCFLQKGPHQIRTLLDGDIDQDLLFFLLSCFPPEQLNTMFIKIQNHFPDELTVDSPDGNSLNVKVLFQTPSTDLTYLVSKVKLYLQLFFGSGMPIIQEITQMQTRRLMGEFLQNNRLYEQVQEQVKSIIDFQITPRLELYTVFELHFKKLTQKRV